MYDIFYRFDEIVNNLIFPVQHPRVLHSLLSNISRHLIPTGVKFCRVALLAYLFSEKGVGVGPAGRRREFCANPGKVRLI